MRSSIVATMATYAASPPAIEIARATAMRRTWGRWLCGCGEAGHGTEGVGGGRRWPLTGRTRRRVPALASGELQARHGGRAHARTGSRGGCEGRIGRVLLHETVPSVPGSARATNDTGRVRFMQPGLHCRRVRTSARCSAHCRPAPRRRSHRAGVGLVRPRPRRPAERSATRSAACWRAACPRPRRRCWTPSTTRPRCWTRASLRRGRATSPSSARPASRWRCWPTRSPRPTTSTSPPTPASPTWSSARRWTGWADSWATRPRAARSRAAA